MCDLTKWATAENVGGCAGCTFNESFMLIMYCNFGGDLGAYYRQSEEVSASCYMAEL